MEVAPFQMEVAPFLSIFTIFCRFSPFFIDFHDLRTFLAIYILSQFTHFLRQNSLLCNITRCLHVWIPPNSAKLFWRQKDFLLRGKKSAKQYLMASISIPTSTFMFGTRSELWHMRNIFNFQCSRVSTSYIEYRVWTQEQFQVLNKCCTLE